MWMTGGHAPCAPLVVVSPWSIPASNPRPRRRRFRRRRLHSLKVKPSPQRRTAHLVAGCPAAKVADDSYRPRLARVELNAGQDAEPAELGCMFDHTALRRTPRQPPACQAQPDFRTAR
jgi:hypothetical protein